MEMGRTDSDLRKTYTLPDGQDVSIGKERFQCPEILFKSGTDFDGNGPSSLQETVYKSIMMCEEKHRNHLFSNIVLAGGSSMLQGFVERLEKVNTKNPYQTEGFS